MQLPVVTPETWYRCFWIGWAIAAIVAARIWLVNPIIRAIEKASGS